ncbi:hypothetical protein SZ55_0672 [Pseudomonas sp. FeS53a]|nr:hypothetical protein SZ55_0672 [Pseudomonas sp. FeS53a]
MSSANRIDAPYVAAMQGGPGGVPLQPTSGGQRGLKPTYGSLGE